MFNSGIFDIVTEYCSLKYDLKTKLVINASLPAVPVYRKHLGRAGAWNIFRNNFEEYPTTNETDFMGSVTMSPASGRQLTTGESQTFEVFLNAFAKGLTKLLPKTLCDGIMNKDKNKLIQ